MKPARVYRALKWIFFTELVGVLGSVFTVSSMSVWYQTLIKPLFNPPSFIFGPVWITLYALMGMAMFLVWENSSHKTRRVALLVFGIQLFLNGIWSPIFFGVHDISLALIDIIALLFAVLWMIIVFKKAVPITFWLLVPYMLWISFAAYLNLALLLLN